MPFFNNAYLYKETEKAWLIGFEEDEYGVPESEKVWIPISVIEDTDICNLMERGYVQVPEWFVKKNDLDHYVDDDIT